MNPDTLFFFEHKPAALALYAALQEWICTEWPDTRIKVQKTQISFSNRYIFAFASLPRRKNQEGSADYLIVSFGLGRPLSSARLLASAEVRWNRWTHHVAVAAPEELDEELWAWIREAYAFSAGK